MKNHLDFTIDFETTALTANAGVMQVAIVPWFRNNDTDPFDNEYGLEPFVAHVDLRTCVVDGFDFDADTIKWWSERNYAAKRAVTDGLPEPITDVLISALDYIRDIVKRHEISTLCLWSQGPDVDIAILRNLCHKYDVELESIVPYTSFRDCRTIIQEAVLSTYGCPNTTINDNNILVEKIIQDPSLAYKQLDPLPDRYAGGSEAHDALFDALRSSWNTWQSLKLLNKK